jgi:hypothetical protein
MSQIPIIYGPDPITFYDHTGSRYWIHHPFPFTGNAGVDERLSGYPVVVFQPHGRDPGQTPVVIGLQGMSAPFQWNTFLIPMLLDMGIACVLFDIPLAGERSLARNYRGNILTELAPLLDYEVKLGTALVPRAVEAVAHDFGIVLRLIEERHGLTDPRRALFGVSLGTVMAAFAFLRDGVGLRLLGTIGHADLRRFARSYAPALTPLVCALPVRQLGRLLTLLTGRNEIRAGVDFLHVLNELRHDGQYTRAANPMRYLDRIGSGRRVRFLVGVEDRLVRPEDAKACARRFPDGACYVVSGMGHGNGAFDDHVRYFVGTQLGDWGW